MKLMERRNVVTLFVYNILMTIHWKGLWTLFRYHGNVVDAFIPTRKSKKGRRYVFMRFNNGRDAQRVITKLNGFILVENRI